MHNSFDRERLSYHDIVYAIEEDGTLSVIEYRGNNSALTIPHTLQGRTVTRIASSAFRNCNWIALIEIPASIIHIDEDAFPNADQKKTDRACTFTPTSRRDMEYMYGYDYMSVESRMIGIERGVINPLEDSDKSSKGGFSVAVFKGSYAEKYCKDNNIRIERYL